MNVICRDCNTPVAQLQGSDLIIKNKHHGVVHETVLTIDSLLDLIAASASLVSASASTLSLLQIQGRRNPFLIMLPNRIVNLYQGDSATNINL